MSDIDLDRLKAAAFHEHEPTEMPVFEIKCVDYPNYTELSCDGIEICVFWWGLRPGSHHPTTAMFDDLSAFKTGHDFDIAIALLQEARRRISEAGK